MARSSHRPRPMWTIRRAATTDLGALKALCASAVGPDDYVPMFLEEFLRTGVVLVAEDADELIGMVVYHDVPDGSAWLHAARTRPEYRRKGVATNLMTRCEALARRHHRTSMRLWANADNIASVRANRKYGFRERARFTRMRLAIGRATGGVRLEPLQAREGWALVADSTLVRQGGGYVFHEFYFLPVTQASMRLLAADHALWGLRGNVISISEDFEDPGHRGVQIQLLAGDPSELLRAIPSVARARDALWVESFLPHEPSLLRRARRAGFALMDWGQEAVVFEKRLRARGASAGTGPRTASPRGRRRGSSVRRAASPRRS